MNQRESMQVKHSTAFFSLIVFMNLGAVIACGSRQTALVASEAVSGEPVPLWSAVTDTSSFACYMSDMMHRLIENVKVDIHDSTMKVKTAIPDDGKTAFGFKIVIK
jgi:hypothetical protein